MFTILINNVAQIAAETVHELFTSVSYCEGLPVQVLYTRPDGSTIDLGWRTA